MSKNNGCYQYFLKKKSSPSPNVQKTHFCTAFFRIFFNFLKIIFFSQWVEQENAKNITIFKKIISPQWVEHRKAIL